MMRAFWGILGLAAGLATPVLAQEQAVPGTTPIVVEVFTSTNCPSCPATESKLNTVAAGRKDILVVLEHVDYWNKGAARPDPWASPDFTQRQYDYSNRLARRAGEVFTPQPVLDGARVANPPMWLNWSGALSEAISSNDKALLRLTRTGADISVAWPTGLQGTNGGELEVVAMGLTQDEKNTNLWRATGISVLPAMSSGQKLAAANLPKGDRMLVLLQDAGGGRVRGMGLLN